MNDAYALVVMLLANTLVVLASVYFGVPDWLFVFYIFLMDFHILTVARRAARRGLR